MEIELKRSLSRSSFSGESKRSPSHESNRRAPAATIIPIRASKDGGLEVLCGQNLVVNYLKSHPGQHRTIMNSPGEFRFLGAMRKVVDVTPLDTAVRGLTSAGWHNAQRYIRSYVAERQTLDRAALQATLFKVTGPGTKSGGNVKVFHFICAMDPAVADHFASTLNQLLEAQQKYCVEYGEDLFSIPVAERAPLCPIFHRVNWWRIDDILERLQWDFINEFQESEFMAHGLKERAISTNSHMEVLRRLRPLCVQAAFERGYRRERKALDMNLINRCDSKYYDLQACAPDFDRLQLLSFNLNVLPFGVAALHFGGRQHNTVRLRCFLNHVREALNSPPKKNARRGDNEAGFTNRRKPSNRIRLGFFTSRDSTGPHDETRALDVIALQELFASPFVPGCCSQTYAIREMSKLGYAHVTGDHPSTWDLLRRGKWTDSGLVIFSRLPVVGSASLRFSAGASLDAGACKGAIWARLELAKNKYLDVFNCHLQASHTGVDGEVFERIRSSQMSELCDFIRQSGSEHPFVLTGDFNVDAIPEPLDPTGTFGIAFRPPRLESEDYKQMMESLAPAGRLVDLLCGPTTEDPLGGATTQSERRHPCTRPPRLKLPGSMRYMAKHKYPQRLDYIFYRPTLPSLVEHSRTRIDTFEIRGIADFEHLSDHYGIRSHFRLRCGFAWRHAQQQITEEKPAPPQQASFVAGRACTFGLGAIIFACLGVTLAQKLGCARSTQLLPSRYWRPSLSTLFDEWHTLISRFLSDALQYFCIVAAPILVSKRNLSQSALQEALDDEFIRQQSPSCCSEADEVSPPSPKEGDVSGIGAARPIAMSPYDSFTHTMEDYGGRRCIGRREVRADGTLGDYVWLTYLEAQHEVLRISSGLHRKYGLKRNSRVGLLGDASAEWLLCDLALMRCGVDTVCVTAPSDESTKGLELLLCSPEWLENFVALARNRMNDNARLCPIVTFKRVSPRLAAQAEHNGLQISDLSLVAHFGEAAGWVPYVGFGAWEVFTTMYRSRSGAKSDLESVSINLRDLARAAHTVAKALDLNSDDVHFSYSWPAFAAERVVLYAVLASGGAIGFFSGTRSPRIFEEIRRLEPTFLQGSPSLFRRQITRLRHKHIGPLGRMCFQIHSWALRRAKVAASTNNDPNSTLFDKICDSVSSYCISAPIANWLAIPFVKGKETLLGRKTRLRFVLALCTVGSTVLPPERCLWMRVIFGCPVYKGLVVVEAGGLVTLGEAPYFGDSAVDSFVVGNELPGVQIDLLPWELPENQPMNVCGSHAQGVEHGTVKVCGLNGTEARIGVVCGRHMGKLCVFGRLVSLVASSDGQPALCEALEQLFVQSTGPWLMQLLLTAESRGVVGIAVVRLEELWRTVRWKHIGARRSSLEDLCLDRRVRAFCLAELQKCAKANGLADWECPRAIHLESKPFSLEAGLQTPTFQLRREQLLPRYQNTIVQLYNALDVQESETDCPSPRSNFPMTRTSSAQWERG